MAAQTGTVREDSGTGHRGRQGSSAKELRESHHRMTLRFLPDSHLTSVTHQAGLRISGKSPNPKVATILFPWKRAYTVTITCSNQPRMQTKPTFTLRF